MEKKDLSKKGLTVNLECLPMMANPFDYSFMTKSSCLFPYA
jgi:hypothetical protein